MYKCPNISLSELWPFLSVVVFYSDFKWPNYTERFSVLFCVQVIGLKPRGEPYINCTAKVTSSSTCLWGCVWRRTFRLSQLLYECDFCLVFQTSVCMWFLSTLSMVLAVHCVVRIKAQLPRHHQGTLFCPFSMSLLLLSSSYPVLLVFGSLICLHVRHWLEINLFPVNCGVQTGQPVV